MIFTEEEQVGGGGAARFATSRGFVYHARSDVRRRLEDNPGDRLVTRRCAERALICPVLLHVLCTQYEYETLKCAIY